jgi:hypothetical protein
MVPLYGDMKWCKQCNAFKPLTEFPIRRTSNECREHASLRMKNYHNDQKLSNPRRSQLWMMTRAAYTDTTRGFSKEGWKFTMVEAADICRDYGIEPGPSVRAVPICPEKGISPSNVCLVTKQGREMTVKIWSTSHDIEIYTKVRDSVIIPKRTRTTLPKGLEEVVTPTTCTSNSETVSPASSVPESETSVDGTDMDCVPLLHGGEEGVGCV